MKTLTFFMLFALSVGQTYAQQYHKYAACAPHDSNRTVSQMGQYLGHVGLFYDNLYKAIKNEIDRNFEAAGKSFRMPVDKAEGIRLLVMHSSIAYRNPKDYVNSVRIGNDVVIMDIVGTASNCFIFVYDDLEVAYTKRSCLNVQWVRVLPKPSIPPTPVVPPVVIPPVVIPPKDEYSPTTEGRGPNVNNDVVYDQPQPRVENYWDRQVGCGHYETREIQASQYNNYMSYIWHVWIQESCGNDYYPQQSQVGMNGNMNMNINSNVNVNRNVNTNTNDNNNVNRNVRQNNNREVRNNTHQQHQQRQPQQNHATGSGGRNVSNHSTGSGGRNVSGNTTGSGGRTISSGNTGGSGGRNVSNHSTGSNGRR